MNRTPTFNRTKAFKANLTLAGTRRGVGDGNRTRVLSLRDSQPYTIWAYTNKIIWCAEQELNLHSRQAGDLQSLDFTSSRAYAHIFLCGSGYWCRSSYERFKASCVCRFANPLLVREVGIEPTQPSFQGTAHSLIASLLFDRDHLSLMFRLFTTFLIGDFGECINIENNFVSRS